MLFYADILVLLLYILYKKTMKNSIILALIFVLISASSSFAQLNEHPIDIEIRNCFNSNPSSLGIIECEIMGLQKWSAEVESLNKKIVQKIDKHLLEAYTKNFTQWEELKKTQFEFYSKAYEKYKGTKGITLTASSKTDFVRNKALELQELLYMIEHK